jgi:hypothetical protein
MNINFHYAAIKVLAHHADFSLPESQLIAYASQYVDDATEHRKIGLSRDPEVEGIRYEDGEFDPICTAHKDLDYIKGALSRRSRKLVYVCFHFLPSLTGQTSASRRQVKRNGRLARRLVTDAISAWKAAESREEEKRTLIQLGVALHSYADTWSHQGFSGDWDRDNNDISDVEIKRGAQWRDTKLISKFLSYAGPDIGHAELGTLPDRSDTAWRCKPRKRSTVGQDNCREFLEASDAILGLLSKARGNAGRWNGVKAKLRRCLRNPADHEDFGPRGRHEWRRQFPRLAFNYGPRDWFDAALKPGGGLLDLLGSTLRLDPEDFEVSEGREYFYFQAAAWKQRQAVRKAIRQAGQL